MIILKQIVREIKNGINSLVDPAAAVLELSLKRTKYRFDQ